MAFDEGDDLHFAIYAAAYAILRDYDNRPEGDRGLIRAGDYRIPKLIAATAAASIRRARPTPATPEEAADKLAHILRRKLERGEPIDAEAIDRALALATYSQDPTAEDRAWAANEAARIASPAVGDREGLRSICQNIADDYQTSESHHPDHVLIRKEHFDAILAALQPQAKGGE